MRPSRLKSPNLWVLILSVLAVLGIVASVIGWAARVLWLRIVGAVMIAPIIIGGLILIVVVIPTLIVANRRMRKRTTDKQQRS